MNRKILAAALIVGVAACAKHEEPEAGKQPAKPYKYSHSRELSRQPQAQPPMPSGASAEVPLGKAGDEPRHVAFRIVKVYEAQKATGDGLGHADGGTWQFFDAVTSDGAPFTFGFVAKPASGEMPMGFGDFVLATAERGRFVASLAKGFGQAVPAAAGAARKGKPIHMRLVVLGRNQARSPGGGYSDGGSWTATKLFFEASGAEAEVFFNFDVVGKSGEFSEKDADYDKDVVGIAASQL